MWVSTLFPALPSLLSGLGLYFVDEFDADLLLPEQNQADRRKQCEQDMTVDPVTIYVVANDAKRTRVSERPASPPLIKPA